MAATEYSSTVEGGRKKDIHRLRPIMTMAAWQWAILPSKPWRSPLLSTASPGATDRRNRRVPTPDLWVVEETRTLSPDRGDSKGRASAKAKACWDAAKGRECPRRARH